jgi:CheY-like chemotaxis protein
MWAAIILASLNSKARIAWTRQWKLGLTDTGSGGTLREGGGKSQMAQNPMGNQPAAPGAVTTPGTQVLVCDDSPEVLKLLVLMLNSIGLKEVPASNGMEALTVIKTFHPKLVISDIRMPEMNGIELVRAIRQDARLTDIPCVLMSSPDWEANALRVADYFLAKPFNLTSVQQVVQSALYRPE